MAQVAIPTTGIGRGRPTAGRRRVGGVALAVLCGCGVAAQSRINGDLGARLHDGFAAATISFGLGLVLILALVPAIPSSRRGVGRIRAALRGHRLRFWECFGGACGAFVVIAQGITVAGLGVAVFTVAFVAGQSCASLVVDRLGLGPGGARPLSLTRVVGALLAVVAVVIAVSGRLAHPSSLSYAVLPALTGLGAAWQQAVNGRVRGFAGSAMTASGLNFLVGTVVVLVAFAVEIPMRGLPTGHLPREPWLYLGGALGVIFIAVAAAVVRVTGVLLLGLSMVAGQLGGALALDLLVPEPGARPGRSILIGIGLTLVSVLLAAIGRDPERQAEVPAERPWPPPGSITVTVRPAAPRTFIIRPPVPGPVNIGGREAMSGGFVRAARATGSDAAVSLT